MTQVEKTEKILEQATTSSEALLHLCHLMAKTVDLLEAGQAKKAPKKKAGTQPVLIKTFLDQCKADGLIPIPPTDPIFEYTKEAGIPDDFLKLYWFEFVERHMENRKKQKSWPQHFRNYVRGNYYSLWYCGDGGEYLLNSAGQQARRKHNNKKES